MGYANKRGVSMNEETWKDFIKLQELTGMTKAALLRMMLKKELLAQAKSNSNKIST